MAESDENRYEVQDADDRGYLAWFSDAPYLSPDAAVMIAESRELPTGWRRVVRHVGDGTVIWRSAD